MAFDDVDEAEAEGVDDGDGDEVPRVTAKRGSRFPAAPPSLLASGTGPALPGVGSADDSRCFDLSGDSPATDASIHAPRVARTPTEP
ncbi:hypothetical protein [Streptomyces incanus]|uniref:Uncharacterized protein n=1 Tax=Streptomyces incanus TaxID=887453 RepID=A0ABW0XGV5_9ACTN